MSTTLDFSNYVRIVTDRYLLLALWLTTYISAIFAALPGRAQQAFGEHREVLEAMAARNADATESTMRHHIAMPGSVLSPRSQLKARNGARDTQMPKRCSPLDAAFSAYNLHQLHIENC